MPSDDNPIEALRHQVELENSSRSPVMLSLTAALLYVLDKAPKAFAPLFATIFGIAIGKLKDYIAADTSQKAKLMLDTVADEVLRHDAQIREIKGTLSSSEAIRREEAALALLVDAARKSTNTRSVERVRRIGLIIATTLIDKQPIDADVTEEMMRVAMEVGDTDFKYLEALALIEGRYLESHGHVDRFNAYTFWEQGFWGTTPGGESESVFRKLESYGLVAAIPPPNNQTIQADIQTRFVLLAKGWRFYKLAGPSIPR